MKDLPSYDEVYTPEENNLYHFPKFFASAGERNIDMINATRKDHG
jgi:hypothetical protein